MAKINVVDTTLRDGSHTVSHNFTTEDIKAIVKGLDESGISLIEVGHGDGLMGSTINYGFSKHTDVELIAAAAEVVKNAMLTVLLIPGIGTVEDLEKIKEAGAKAVRVATHVTEADVSEQHIKAAKAMGMFTIGFLMMAHMAPPEKVLEEAKKMESYGADVIYCTDSAGAMLPSDVRARIQLLVSELSIPVGFHAHNNLGLAIGNSIAAIESGATYVDGSLGGLGAGAGNTATEMLIAVLDKLEVEHQCDLYRAMDANSDVLIPIIKAHGLETKSNNDPMMLGYAGVYSSFMLHARRAAKRFDVDYRDIIVELGKKKAVGGQEDWIVEMASILSKKNA